MGETGVHVDVIFAVLGMLRHHYSGQDRVAVLSNMFLYYQEGDPRKVVCPDLFVTLDVPSTTTRRTFRTWLEGKGPDLVIEVTSKKTRNEDLKKKFEIYRDVLKVREYFLFDPLDEYLDPSLQGFRLVESRYEPVAHDGSGVFSEVLGLRLERSNMDLRFFDPIKGRPIPTGEELTQAVVENAEARARAEEELRRVRREEAEARARADEEIRRLRREEAEARARADEEIQRLRRENEALLRRLLEEKR